MGKGQQHEAKVSLGLGAISLGRGRQNADHPELWNQIFTVRKNGIEYLGQLTVRSVSPAIDVEVFNSNYFADFCLPKNQIVDLLQTKILGLIVRNGDSQAIFKTAVRTLLKKNIPRAEPAFSSYGEMSDGLIDLDEIYRRLNDQYFGGGVQARVMWGRDSRTRNRSGFRFGSYEEDKKLIRVHPRLRQDFVPVSVVELTVYHEMCHQWVPSIRKNGAWRPHHPGFREKEKEYCHYQEARQWEKQHWKKLLQPVRKK
jgi:hypothetical protein